MKPIGPQKAVIVPASSVVERNNRLRERRIFSPIDLEEAYLLASDADMWLNVGMANSLDDLKASCPKFTDTRCFKNGEVYNNNARTNTAGGNDYYESAVVNPDIVLRDLVKIFHPELVQEECVYYKQLK